MRERCLHRAEGQEWRAICPNGAEHMELMYGGCGKGVRAPGSWRHFMGQFHYQDKGWAISRGNLPSKSLHLPFSSHAAQLTFILSIFLSEGTPGF